MAEILRNFDTGATRDTDDGKYDYEAFLSPHVIEAYGAYMHEHRKQPDGKLRDGDNWQKGIPLTVYIKSAWRHFLQLWMIHRGLIARDEKGNRVTLRQAACGVLFNVMGYLHEVLQKEYLDRSQAKCCGARPMAEDAIRDVITRAKQAQALYDQTVTRPVRTSQMDALQASVSS